ncbi:MAG: PAS domain S-box protein [Desulfobacterales bacterium]|jgi:PAS domain S-box-containing protein
MMDCSPKNDADIDALKNAMEAQAEKCRRLERKLSESIALLKRTMESREKFRILVEDIDAVIFSINTDGIVTYISPTIEKYTAFKPPTYHGRHFLDAVHSGDRERVLAACANIRSDNLGSTEYRLIHKNGGYRWVRSFSRPIMKGGVYKGLRGVGIDITRLRQAEETARTTEQKYQSLLDSIEEGFFEADLKGNLQYVSPTLCRITGIDADRLLGKPFRRFISPKMARRLVRFFAGIYRTDRHAIFPDLIMENETRTMIVEVAASLIRENDSPVGFRGLIRDITARRKAEEGKEKLEQQLQEAQRLEAVGTLAGGIAHNFNNILMAMQGNISLLLLKADPDRPETKKLINLEQCIKDGAGLTRQLLDFARGRKGTVKPENLNDLVAKTAQLFGRAKREITVDTSGLKRIWIAEVDASQIQQVLLNLYVNAWHAMPGGGTLSIRTCNVILRDHLVQSSGIPAGRYVKVAVSDTGEGMDETIKQKIFHPFFTTKDKHRGTGLGLTSAYGIIKNHGGTIQVNSRKGQGTTFCIYLPASGKPLAPAKTAPETPIRGTGTILVVDDEPFILDITCEGLREIGYSVLAARHGKEALEIFRANQGRIDLVILDLIMPEMDGGETYRHLRQLNPEVNVILTSGYDYNQQVEALRRQGCRDFIQKPFDIATLSEKVGQILAS